MFATLAAPGTKFFRERFAEQVVEIRGSAQPEQVAEQVAETREGAGEGAGGQQESQEEQAKEDADSS